MAYFPQACSKTAGKTEAVGFFSLVASYVLGIPKLWLPSSRLAGLRKKPHPPMGGFVKRGEKQMEQEEKYRSNKGGRPAKAVKRNKPLTVKCTILEQKVIAVKAKKAGLTTSQYLRELGLNGNVVMRVETLPKEMLALTAALNHVGGLLNQIAKKRNSNEELNALERADLKVLEGKVKEILETIKTGMNDWKNNDGEIIQRMPFVLP